MLYYFWYISVLCFFFFKQKTAYEMRISDWSSDVCSSDLRIAQPAFRGKPPSRALGILAALRGTCVPCCADGRKGFTVRGYGLARQIGRASCRERVCQYV